MKRPALIKVLLAVPLAAMLAVACTAPTEPLVPAGTYALQAFASHPLPAVTFENVVFRQSIVADTVFISSDGSGIRRLTRLSEFLDGARAPEQFSQEIAFTVERAGGTLVVAEQVFCLDSHTPEECGLQPLTLAGAVLEIGLRRYTRVADAP